MMVRMSLALLMSNGCWLCSIYFKDLRLLADNPHTWIYYDTRKKMVIGISDIPIVIPFVDNRNPAKVTYTINVNFFQATAITPDSVHSGMLKA